ncbi:C-type lectin domain family 14 member A [Anoplopoma fimbria]|uniref:C-type lectin domain family 14 member A n=1 Tax=Anoplopoma fimbria TaxID=229290 RepID=UPI0023EB2340|nr:C-type lectin domain family 14 member A [Anoplopoma fimbria]
MESWFSWVPLVILFGLTWSDPASSLNYTIRHTKVSFDQAAADCSPGVLTTLATDQEVADVLRLIPASSLAHQKDFTFWVGLRKVKDECVVPTLPLRGFKWTEDGSEDTQVSRWTEEPKNTCTTVRCAALKGEWNGSKVTSWGLIPVSCRNSYQFICKLRDTAGRPAAPEPTKPAAPEPPKPAAPEPTKPAAPEPPKPAAPEPTKPAAPEPPKPAAPEPTKPAAPEPTKPAAPESPKPAATEPSKPAVPEPTKPAAPEPRPPTSKPEPANREPGLPSLGPKPDTDLKPDPGSDLCQHPLIPSARSISFANSSRVQVECWSTDQVELRCSGRPALWRLLDDSPANFTTVCLPCETGFRKDVSGNCVDVDECGGAPCRHSCLNTEGSFRCVCSDDNGKHHNEDSLACADAATSGILIPVLVAVAALVVLVVVVAVTVKCCLMSQSKKRAMKKAEKMAMKSNAGRDAFETANEKAA